MFPKLLCWSYASANNLDHWYLSWLCPLSHCEEQDSALGKNPSSYPAFCSLLCHLSAYPSPSSPSPLACPAFDCSCEISSPEALWEWIYSPLKWAPVGIRRRSQEVASFPPRLLLSCGPTWGMVREPRTCQRGNSSPVQESEGRAAFSSGSRSLPSCKF